MQDKPTKNGRLAPAEIRIPLLREAIGLGDAIRAVTSAVGIKPCAPCKRRAALLNAKLKLIPR